MNPIGTDTRSTPVAALQENCCSETPSGSGALLQIRIARTIAEVEELRPIWSKWKSHRDSDIDFCLEFVWRSDDFLRPHVIVLYRDGQPDAMLIGRIESGRMRPKIGYFQLFGIGHRLLAFAQGALLGNSSAENSEHLVRSVMKSLTNGEADMALFHQWDVRSPLFEKAITCPNFGCRDHLAEPSSHNTMKIAENMEQVYLGFSASLRSDVRRKKKKLAKDFGDRASFWTAHQPAQFEGVIPQIEVIARKSYQRGLGVGFEDTEQMRRRLRVCAENDWLRIYLLSIDQKLCSYWIGTVYEGSFCSDYLAFDTEFASYSPGTLQLMQMIEEFCVDGTREIDFGSGAGRYKERFGNMQKLESSVYVFAPSIRGLVLNAVQTVSGKLDRAAKKGLEKTQLLPKIKKLWRNWSTAGDKTN